MTPQQIEDQPWRYSEYRGLSIWAASDDTLILRFDILNARVILYLQDEIVRIESDLEELGKG